MTLAIYGTLAAVTALFFAACLTLTPTFGAPAGHHHKPSLRRRLHERNQREQARDAETEELFEGMEVPPEIARDTIPAGEAAERAMWGEHYGQPGEPGWDGTDEEYAAAMAAGRPVSLNAEQAHARGWDTCDGGPLMPLPPDVAHECIQVEEEPPQPVVFSEDELAIIDSFEDEPEDPHDVATPGDQADALVGGVRHDPEMDYRDETGTWPALMAEVAAEVTQ
jgi:hypothetical protein